MTGATFSSGEKKGSDEVRDRRAAGHGVWPRIRLIVRADNSDFTKNPAAGLSAISSA
jgi:hypothetical protein